MIYYYLQHSSEYVTSILNNKVDIIDDSIYKYM